jgi:hypothetical protein
MGALHAGHSRWCAARARSATQSCASVFVNPLQFDDARDFERYPRDVASDSALLDGARCDMVFSGTLEQFFPESGGRAKPSRGAIRVRARRLGGRASPGHFAGVATIVARLFELSARGGVLRRQGLPADAGRARARAQRGGAAHRRRVRPCASRAGCASLRAISGFRTEERNQSTAIIRYTPRRSRTVGPRDCDCAASSRSAFRALTRRAPPLGVEYAAVRDPEQWSAGDPPGRLERASRSSPRAVGRCADRQPAPRSRRAMSGASGGCARWRRPR